MPWMFENFSIDHLLWKCNIPGCHWMSCYTLTLRWACCLWCLLCCTRHKCVVSEQNYILITACQGLRMIMKSSSRLTLAPCWGGANILQRRSLTCVVLAGPGPSLPDNDLNQHQQRQAETGRHSGLAAHRPIIITAPHSTARETGASTLFRFQSHD